MKIFFGEDQVSSRKAFVMAKKDKSILEFSGESVTLADVLPVVNTQSLFSETVQTLAFENLFSSRPSNRKTEIIEYLLAQAPENVLIWEGKDVSAQVKNFPPLSLAKYDLPKTIFAFLDNPSVDLLHTCLKSLPVEQIFASLVTRNFKRQNISNLQKLLELDYKNKTSQLPFDLVYGLELYIMESNAQTLRN